jgi:hypothetical protein
VILTRDVNEHGLCAGDVDTVVERHVVLCRRGGRGRIGRIPSTTCANPVNRSYRLNNAGREPLTCLYFLGLLFSRARRVRLKWLVEPGSTRIWQTASEAVSRSAV